MSNKDPFVLDREQGFRGREGINLLVHFCHSMLFVFYSFFLILPFFFFLNVLLIFVVILLEVPITLFVIFFFLFFPMHGKSPLYSACRDRILLF